MRRFLNGRGKAKGARYLFALVVVFGAGLAASAAFGMVSLAGGDSSTTTVATDSTTTTTDPGTTTTTDPGTTTTTTSSTTTTTTTPSAPAAAPTVRTDKLDYAPGSTVYITGANWQAGEAVRIFTNDTLGNSWSQTDNVTADANGAVADQVVLPSYFISDYTVTATGAQSGTATTTFTDAVNYQLLGKDGAAHNPNAAQKPTPEEDLGSVASGTSISAACPTGLTAKASGLGGGQSTSYAIGYVGGFGDNATLSSHTTISPATGTFNGNGQTCTSMTISTTGLAGGTYHGELQMTNTGGATGSPDFYYFKFTITNSATSISAVSGSGTYGGTATLTATLQSGGSGLAGKSVAFTLNGTSVGNATTNPSGVATLSGVSLSGVNAGTQNGAVVASFAGDSGYSGSTGSGNLTVAKADSATIVSCPASVTYDGSAKTPCSASATGAGGLNQTLTVTYSNNTAAGTATADATYAGDANHNSSSGSATFSIGKASSTTNVSCPSSTLTFDGSAKTPCSATVTGAGGLNQSLTVTYSNNTAAGTATANASFAGDSNHDPSSGSATFTIGKAPSSTSVSCPASVTYDGSAKTPCSAIATGAGGLNQSLSVDYSNNTNAGTASASATFAGDSNHDSSSDSKTFAIAKADQTIAFTDAPFSATYNDTFQVHPTASSGLAVSLGGTAGVCSVTLDALQPGVFDVKMLSGTGTCVLTASQSGNTNYNPASSVSANVLAAKASQSIDFAALGGKTFGDADFGVSASASSGLGVSFASSGDCSVSGSTVHISGAGSCTITASQGGNTNYSAAADVARSFSIGKAASSVAVTCAAGPFTYTGTAQTPCSAAVTGVGGLNQTLTVDYSSNTDAGTATASATFAGDANHNGSSNSATFTIDKAGSSVSVDCPSSKTYTGSAIEPCTASVSGAGGLNAALSVTYSNNLNAGKATASAGYAGDGNHNGSNGSADFTIDKAPSHVAVTCPPSATYTGSALEPCTAHVSGAGGLNASLSVGYSDNTNAGTATASASYGGDDNHGSDSASTTFTIEKAPSSVAVTCPDKRTYTGSAIEPCSAKATGAGGLSVDLTVTYAANVAAGTATASATYAGDANHQPSGNSATFTIAKAASAVAVNCPDHKTFTGSPMEPCTANVTGAGGLNKALTVAYSDNTNAGTATASASYDGDANHNGSNGSATFTIDKAGSSVAVNCPGHKTFTGSAIEPCDATVTGAGGLNASLPVSYSDNTNAGTATANAAYAGDANHNGSNGSATFTIDKAGSTVAVTCPDHKTYTGSAIEPCTAKVTGAGGLDGTLSVSYSGNLNAGTATASASYGGDANHLGDSGSATFAIDKAPSATAVTCTAGPFVYNGSPHKPCTAVVTGAGGLNTALTVTYGDNVAAGTATAAAAYDGDANHTSSSDSQTFKIDKAPSAVTIGCPTAAQTYTSSAIEPCTAKASGAGGLDVDLTVSYADNVNAGTATASASYDGDANHNGSSSSAHFTIAKAPSKVTVVCDAGPFTYTGGAQTPCSAKVTGVGGLDAALPVSYADNVNAGTATASASYGGDANHLGDSGSQTFAIGKASSKVTVGCDPGPFTYSGSPFTPCSANVTGAGGLNQALSVSYSGNTGAGTANASASYAGDANHTGDSASATFTIDKAPSHVALTCPDSKTFTGSAIEPCSARATGAGGLDTAVPVSYTDNVNAGTAHASASYAGDANHLGDSASGTFAIAKAPSTTTVTCSAGPFTYNGSAQTPCSAKATGAGGLNADLPVSYSDNTNAGTATASATYDGDANHTDSNDSKTFAIGKATPTVTLSWSGWTYDGAAHPATGAVTGVAGAALGTPTFTYYSGTGTSGTPLAGAPSGVGTFTVNASYAGSANYTSANKTKTITVLYRFDGFLQPINDTAHQGGFESNFKLGSTVPAKFQLKKADGTVVQAGALPVFSRSTNPIACDVQLSPETLDTDTGFTGSTFRWDATAQQYIYNWSTKGLKAGEYRLYATIDDGSKLYVDICLQ